MKFEMSHSQAFCVDVTNFVITMEGKFVQQLHRTSLRFNVGIVKQNEIYQPGSLFQGWPG